MSRLTFSFYVITIDLLTHVYLSFEVVFQTPGSVYVSTDDLHWVPNTHVPITVCESLFAYHFTQPPPALPTPPQPPNTNPYRIHVSNESYARDGQLTVTVNGTKGFKVSLGFLLR